MLILGLAGNAGSGKDLVADRLVNNHGFTKMSFADPMKRFCRFAFGLYRETLWGPSEERNKDVEVDEKFWLTAIDSYRAELFEILSAVPHDRMVQASVGLFDWLSNLRQNYKRKVSARTILQTLGTEWGRSIDENMWSKYALNTIRYIDEQGLGYTQPTGVFRGAGLPKIDKIVITDHRFANEIQNTQAAGGYVIKIIRKAKEDEKEKKFGVEGHSSESVLKGLSNDYFDVVLSLDEGIEKVHAAVDALMEGSPWQKKES